MTETTEKIEVQGDFKSLGLSDVMLKTLDRLGYEVPTPIQSATIPSLLEGRDFLGQAQTGTGKTAAFALPLLTRIDLSRKAPQLLVLTPTRELAIQVAEAFQRYASGLEDFHVAPIYGGQEMFTQLKRLKRGVHVVVGTPGRVMDHMRRGTLKLDQLTSIVLDEADEMLRMGFIEDIEWILEAVPGETQVALFSATMPPPIRKIARKHTENPVEVTIAHSKATTPMIRQRFWMVEGMHKASALTRILEVEDYDGILVFVRTKTMTTELATKLEAQGFAASPLSGEMTQTKREETVARFKNGRLDIIVATDVAARGLDIERISHVINYDIPHNVEAYIHRIGRTGRAGRSGEAILFVAPRERGLLFALKKAMGGKMEMMKLPTAGMVRDVRVERFKKSITEALAKEELGKYREILEGYCQEANVLPMDLAAALAGMLHAGKPLVGLKVLPEKEFIPKEKHADESSHTPRKKERSERQQGAPSIEKEGEEIPERKSRKERKGERIRMERYRIDVGKNDGVLPGDLVTLVSSAAGLERQHVGQIEISETFTFLELPEGMPPEVFRDLRKLELNGKPANFSRAASKPRFHKEKK